MLFGMIGGLFIAVFLLGTLASLMAAAEKEPEHRAPMGHAPPLLLNWESGRPGAHIVL